MQAIIETERLILRELQQSDAEAYFKMDADAAVHTYLGNHPMQTIEQAIQAIAYVQQQYKDHNIGRWAVIEKASGEFIGWSGLKLVRETWNNHTDYYDIGYRLMPEYWGKGYATESAKAALAYGFNELNLVEIIGCANIENKASRRALEKCGLTFVEHFYWKDIKCDWLKITREEWDLKHSQSTKY